MRQVVATIDGRPRQAGDRYTLSNQTPRPAGGGFGDGQKETIMRDRFSGSITVAIAAAAVGAVISVSITRTSAQAPAASATAPAASAENALGRTRPAGHLDRRN